ncbi:YopX family protein [Bacillus paranthracis]
MKNLKKMYSGDEIEGEDNLNAWLSYGELAIYRVDDGEYTQLKNLQYAEIRDSEGIEIYEGDICKRTVFAFGEPRKFVGQVMMFEGCWWIDNGTAAVPLWNEMHILEIVGNIYENPELLKKHNKIVIWQKRRMRYE